MPDQPTHHDYRLDRGWRKGDQRISIEDVQKEWADNGPPIPSRAEALNERMHLIRVSAMALGLLEGAAIMSHGSKWHGALKALVKELDNMVREISTDAE